MKYARDERIFLLRKAEKSEKCNVSRTRMGDENENNCYGIKNDAHGIVGIGIVICPRKYIRRP